MRMIGAIAGIVLILGTSLPAVCLEENGERTILSFPSPSSTALQLRHYALNDFVFSWGEGGIQIESDAGNREGETNSSIPLLATSFSLRRFVSFPSVIHLDETLHPPALYRQSRLAKPNPWKSWGPLPEGSKYSEPVIAQARAWCFVQRESTWQFFCAPVNAEPLSWSMEPGEWPEEIAGFFLDSDGDPVLFTRNPRSGAFSKVAGRFIGGGNSIRWADPVSLPQTEAVDEISRLQKPGEFPDLINEFDLKQPAVFLAWTCNPQGEPAGRIRYRISRGPTEPYSAWSDPMTGASSQLADEGQFFQYQITYAVAKDTAALHLPEVLLSYKFPAESRKKPEAIKPKMISTLLSPRIDHANNIKDNQTTSPPVPPTEAPDPSFKQSQEDRRELDNNKEPNLPKERSPLSDQEEKHFKNSEREQLWNEALSSQTINQQSAEPVLNSQETGLTDPSHRKEKERNRRNRLQRASVGPDAANGGFPSTPEEPQGASAFPASPESNSTDRESNSSAADPPASDAGHEPQSSSPIMGEKPIAPKERQTPSFNAQNNVEEKPDSGTEETNSSQKKNQTPGKNKNTTSQKPKPNLRSQSPQAAKKSPGSNSTPKEKDKPESKPIQKTIAPAASNSTTASKQKNQGNPAGTGVSSPGNAGGGSGKDGENPAEGKNADGDGDDHPGMKGSQKPESMLSPGKSNPEDSNSNGNADQDKEDHSSDPGGEGFSSGNHQPQSGGYATLQDDEKMKMPFQFNGHVPNGSGKGASDFVRIGNTSWLVLRHDPTRPDSPKRQSYLLWIPGMAGFGWFLWFLWKRKEAMSHSSLDLYIHSDSSLQGLNLLEPHKSADLLSLESSGDEGPWETLFRFSPSVRTACINGEQTYFLSDTGSIFKNHLFADSLEASEPVADIRRELKQPQIAAMGDCLYLFGQDARGHPYAAICRLDEKSKWKQVPYPPNLHEPLHLGTARGRLWALGETEQGRAARIVSHTQDGALLWQNLSPEVLRQGKILALSVGSETLIAGMSATDPDRLTIFAKPDRRWISGEWLPAAKIPYRTDPVFLYAGLNQSFLVERLEDHQEIALHTYCKDGKGRLIENFYNRAPLPFPMELEGIDFAAGHLLLLGRMLPGRTFTLLSGRVRNLLQNHTPARR